MTHIVRNSCDHGLESPAERRRAGKDDKGNIWIRSYHEGGQVVVEVRDDGRGLNREKLLKKAIEKGIVLASQKDEMSDKQVNELIFAPGFSTAAEVTNVSGRGVGMDVVGTNIQNIGGTVEIESREGYGTCLQLKIPLTLAIVPALIVECASNTFAIPQVKLVELVRVEQNSEDRIELLQGTPVYRLRGNILPLIDLGNVLKLKNAEKRDFEGNEIVNIAVVQADNQFYGLIVDSVHDTADIVVKPLNRLLKSLQVYSGATVLGDGSVSLILDIQGINRVVDIRSTQEISESEVRTGLRDGDEHQSVDEQDYLLIGLNSPTKHALVLNYVNRLEEFKVSSIEFSGDQKLVRYRNKVLPLVSCDRSIGLPEKQYNSDDVLPVIVVERAGKLFGLQVDSILDTLSTSVEVQETVGESNGVIGHLNLEDELVVVLDPFEMISTAFPDFGRLQDSKASRTKMKGLGKAKEEISKINQLISQANILVVEDTSFFRKMIKSSLERAGHKVTLANDGQEAVDLLNKTESPFDLVISDIEMPRLDGFDLAESIRSHSVHGGTPMLALSSRFDERSVERGRLVGFNLYMEKFKPETLNEKVLELIGESNEEAA